MANDQQRDMSGALFRESEKRSEKSPDYRGRLTVAGVTYKLAGWVREGRDGKKFLSLAVSADQCAGGRRDEERVPF